MFAEGDRRTADAGFPLNRKVVYVKFPGPRDAKEEFHPNLS